ncbi:hypothetical protein PRZ48_008844 [Zasmidium cellare]|uniref:Uncharacterized protein n=1 Tax=Zasmidium cellare TaxID=395010 RepID=A0ABR0EHM7_ZASCE|nr:hypothetical protein PRZ48_008844 [Zasmidium cellare]
MFGKTSNKEKSCCQGSPSSQTGSPNSPAQLQRTPTINEPRQSTPEKRHGKANENSQSTPNAPTRKVTDGPIYEEPETYDVLPLPRRNTNGKATMTPEGQVGDVLSFGHGQFGDQGVGKQPQDGSDYQGNASAKFSDGREGQSGSGKS